MDIFLMTIIEVPGPKHHFQQNEEGAKMKTADHPALTCRPSAPYFAEPRYVIT
jgi:hypothetical protein